MEPGAELGHYTVLSEIGRGGMGVVWKARDEKLGREVAIKTLPPEFAQDADRLARFEREAKLLASLNHPNIAAIYGLEQVDTTHFLVLELVEGDTLADRLQRGAIPAEDSLKLALQIAEALEAAHDKGVIHRDLKPANIKVTPDDRVKVLDFGLAKAFAGDDATANPANSPTLSMQATQQGVILGTAAYMSPEQAKGLPVDKRADIFSFGCVLFEMLTGRQAFEGDLATEVLASIIRAEPDYSMLRVDLDPRIREVLGRCFEKDAKKRWQAVGDVRFEIDRILNESGGVSVRRETLALAGPSKLRLVAAVLVTAIVAAAAAWSLWPAEPTSLVARFALNAEGIGNNHGMAWSPDGSRLVYAATVDGVQQLFLRVRNQMEAIPIRDTAGATHPFFSPDGNWVGFFTANELKKVALAGGPSQTLAPAGYRFGATWGPDDTIVFASGDAPGLMEVSASGGEPRPLTVETEDDGGHRWPEFLPDGSGVVFTVLRAALDWQLEVVSPETGERHVLTEGTDASYAPSGHLVFARVGSLWAAPFDLETLELRGEPAPVVEEVQVNTGGWAFYAIAGDGSVAYLPGGSTAAPDILTWVDREGGEEPIGAAAGDYTEPRISPDGTRLAVPLVDAGSGNIDVWVWDFARRNMARLTFDDAEDRAPLWMPDGEDILFFSRRDGAGVYRKAADGTGADETLLSGEPDQLLFPSSLSADASTVLLTQGEGSEVDLGVLALSDSSRTVLLSEDFVEAEASISPDGRWMAYMSDETGQYEVYVRPFPEIDSGRWQVSTEGGSNPIWSRDGSELFFDDGSAVFAVEVEGTNETFSAGIPERVVAGNYDYGNPRRWDVSPDGQRFLMTAFASSATVGEELHIVLNWTEELKERVPVP